MAFEFTSIDESEETFDKSTNEGKGAECCQLVQFDTENMKNWTVLNDYAEKHINIQFFFPLLLYFGACHIFLCENSTGFSVRV